MEIINETLGVLASERNIQDDKIKNKFRHLLLLLFCNAFRKNLKKVVFDHGSVRRNFQNVFSYCHFSVTTKRFKHRQFYVR